MNYFSAEIHCMYTMMTKYNARNTKSIWLSNQSLAIIVMYERESSTATENDRKM